jgi:hypothetical protein
MRILQSTDRTVVDELVAELARLKKRVETLEKAAFASAEEYVEGWTRAAKIVGVNERTCKRRSEAGTFPAPCRIDAIKRPDGADHERPTWRRADLVAYAEGR